MNKIKSLWPIILISLSLGCTSNINILECENKTLETIKLLKISICNDVFTANDIQPNQTTSWEFEIDCQSAFDLNVQLQSGEILNTKLGYITPEFSSHFILKIHKQYIEEISRFKDREKVNKVEFN